MRLFDYLVLGVAAFAARLVAGQIIDFAPYLDPAYYELVARQLVAGEGLTTPALWSFLEVGGKLPADPGLPIPSNGHWMPLTSLVAAGSMLVFGDSQLAAQLPSILVGALLVPLTAMVAWDLWRSRPVALVSGVLAIMAGPMLAYVPLVDGFALFGLGGFLALYGATRVVRDAAGARWLVLSGIGVAIATLTRIDGILLAVAPATAWVIRRGIGPWRVPLPRLSWAAAGACAAVAFVLVLPWLVRQQLVFGTPLPSGGGHTLWITGYNEQFSIGHPVDLSSYLESGLPAIIGSKLASWGLLLGRTATLLGGAFVLSFAYGLWRERKRAELAPFVVYWVVLFALMGGLFTFHAPQGAWYHSAWAWLPFAIPLAVASFMPGVAALGRHLALFSRQRNQRFLLVAAVCGAAVLSLVGSVSLLVGWNQDRQRLLEVAGFLEGAAAPSDVVMVVDPPSLTLETELASVPPPFDPFPVIEDVIRAYDVAWVVVERQPGAATDPLGLWNGAEAVDAEGHAATFLSDVPAYDSEAVRVFAVVPSR